MKACPIGYLTAVSILVSFLAACQPTKDLPWSVARKKTIPPCPTVKFLKDADKITVFKTGSGRDITDIVYEAELTAFTGDCEYIGDDSVYTSVVMTLRVEMDATRGPAANARHARLNYFVAIPDFFPRPEGRKSFKREIAFPSNVNSIGFVDDAIEIKIPLSEIHSSAQTKVFIGFELSKDQLKFNRQRRAGIRLGG